MRRREFICFLGCGLACPCVALAQQSAKQIKIGWLSSNPRDGPGTLAFRQSLKELGHVEGRDIAFEFRFAGANFDRLASNAAELVEQKVDIIVATHRVWASHRKLQRLANGPAFAPPEPYPQNRTPYGVVS